MNIRTRLSIAFLVLVSVGFYVLVRWVLSDLRPRYLETMEETMVDTATVLASFVGADAKPGAIEVGNLRRAFDESGKRRFSAKIYEVIKTHVDMRVYVTDLQGKVVFDSDGGRDEGKDYSMWNDVLRTLRGEYGARTTWTNTRDAGTETLFVAAPILVGGKTAGVLTVSKASGSLKLFIRAAKHKIAIAGATAAMAVILVGVIASVWITRPIHQLTAYANAIRDGKRAAAPKLGRSEIGTLGAAFEQMRDALEGKQYVEGYVQTLTHEMKGPLSAIRGAVELMQEDMPPAERDRFLGNVRTETARMQELIDRLLQLSALETRKELRDVEDINLRELIEEVVSSMQPVLSGKKLAVEATNVEAVTIRGERFLVRQAVSNLLQNATDFSPERGTIMIAVRAAGTRAEVMIEDSGAGVPDYALAKVFDRFYSLRRPDTGQKSSGLGLTFVREVALLHGGEARLENRPGGGARARLILPRSLSGDPR